MHGYGTWSMTGMGFWWILLLGLVFVGVWFLVSASTRNRNTQDESPKQILHKRYARGEIDRDTFEHMLADLNK